MTTLKLNTTKGKPELRLVVDNPAFTPAVFQSRLGKMRSFMKNVRVISNGPYLNRAEREALELANWIEKEYKSYGSRNLGETEANIYVIKLPAEDLRKAAIKLLRERNYAVTYTEIHNRKTARFSVSRVRGK